jgi:hypothetical protein
MMRFYIGQTLAGDSCATFFMHTMTTYVRSLTLFFFFLHFTIIHPCSTVGNLPPYLISFSSCGMDPSQKSSCFITIKKYGWLPWPPHYMGVMPRIQRLEALSRGWCWCTNEEYLVASPLPLRNGTKECVGGCFRLCPSPEVCRPVFDCGRLARRNHPRRAQGRYANFRISTYKAAGLSFQNSDEGECLFV